MGPFLEAILAPSNLWLTVVLGLCCLYWLIVVVGGISADALDVDVDVDGSIDVDPGLDGAAESAIDIDTGGNVVPDGGHTSVANVSVATAVLRFFNLGDVPLMVVLTVLTFVMWAISVGMYPVTRNWTPLLQLALIAATFVIATLVMKAITWPLKRLFHAMREEERKASLQLVGKVCRVISSTVTPTSGQAEFSTSGAPLLLNVRTKQDALSRGDEAVIIGQDERTGVYYVRGF